MKLNFYLIIILLIFSLSAFSYAQFNPNDSLTVENAVRLVLNNNPAIQNAIHSIDASEARVNESKSSLYPEAGISLSYIRLGPIASISFPGFGNFDLFPADNFDEHIGVSATIYDFNKREKNIDLAKSQVQSFRDKLELVKQALAYRTIQTFYTILFLERSLQVQNDAINTLNEHLAITRKKVNAGTATNFDVLTTNVRVSSAEEGKINLKNSLANAEISLRQLLGFPLNNKLTLKGDFSEYRTDYNIDSLINIALQNRYEVKSIEDQIMSEHAKDNVVSAMNNPTVKVAANYGFKNGYVPDLTAWHGNYVAAVQVDIPLSGVIPYFGGHLEESMHQETTANISASESYKSDIIQQVKADVQKSLVDLRSSMDRFQTTDVNVHQAESALGLAKIRYEAGTGTNLDLLDAETMLAQAKLMRLQALYKYVTGRFELLQAIGQKVWQ